MDAENWTFRSMLRQYYETRRYFRDNLYFDTLPTYFKIELKKLEAIVNAFTDGHYKIHNEWSKIKVRELIENGFSCKHRLCTAELIDRLKAMLPYKEQIFEECKIERPTQDTFYYNLFLTVEIGFMYIDNIQMANSPASTLLVSDCNRSIKQIVKRENDKLIEIMLFMLGDKFRRYFTREILIEQWGFPANG